jgi:hypothetical protein
MHVKFIRPRSGNNGRRSVKRTIQNVPAVGSTVKWTDDMSFRVASVEYHLNVTPGQTAPGKASASVLLA